MFDQLPGSFDQVGKHRILHSLDDEALAGGIDILTGDLEHTVCIAQTAQPLQLSGSVTGGHIGDGLDALFLQALEHFVQIIVLEFLCLFVTCGGFSNVTEIRIAKNCADLVGDFNNPVRSASSIGVAIGAKKHTHQRVTTREEIVQL